MQLRLASAFLSKPGVVWKGIIVLHVLLWVSFVMFNGMSYGMTGPFSRYRPLKWMTSWEIA